MNWWETGENSFLYCQEEFQKILGEKDTIDRIWEPFNPSENPSTHDKIEKLLQVRLHTGTRVHISLRI